MDALFSLALPWGMCISGLCSLLSYRPLLHAESSPLKQVTLAFIQENLGLSTGARTLVQRQGPWLPVTVLLPCCRLARADGKM